MKNYYSWVHNHFCFVSKAILVISFVFFNGFTAKAQNVAVAGADVTTTASSPFATLTDAFTSINASAQSGAITITIIGNTTEVAAATLNAGTWTSLSISPSGGAARSITGAFIGNLIDLNGADNVTIDGLNTGGNSLTISNTATSTSTAIRFVNDATNNVIQNCTIQGSGSASFGVVYFGGGTVTGNDGNNINNCNITAAGANLPLNGIYSSGTSTAIDNSGNTINANNISDYYNASSATNGIQLASTGNSAWTITNNRLFQTATRLYTSSGTHNGINIQTGSGYTITGNTIGFANSGGTGTYNIVGSSVLPAGFPSSFATAGTANATRYVAINCAFTVAGTVSSIQNNTMAGFALYTSSGATTTNGIWCGIAVTSGAANIGTTTGNTIGATTGTGSIYTVCTTSGGIAVGIYTNSIDSINIQNNTIGAIDAMGTTASTSGGFSGIHTGTAAGIYNISGNTIGNTTNPNIRTGNLNTGANLSNVGTTNGTPTGLGRVVGILNLSTGTATIGTQALPNVVRNMLQNSTGTTTASSNIGISAQAAGATTISYNTVTNLTSRNAYATVGNGDVSCMGIQIRTGAAASSINNNTISNLASNNTGLVGTNVAGISTAAQTNLTIRNNTITDLINLSTITNTLTPGTASGILIRSGVASAAININNNMISLGNGQATNTSFIGIWGQHGSTPDPIDQIYFNTINIHGDATSGAQPSFGFLRSDFTAIAKIAAVDVRNNIFNNSRTSSGAGTGKHYAIGNNYGATASATGWGSNASNYNVLNSANAATVGYWTTDQTFASWKTVSASDASSITAIPIAFVSSTDLHLNMGITPTQIESGGVAIAGITTDIDNQNRPGPTGSVNGGAFSPDLGADEFDGVFLDLVAPSISYTPLSFTCATGTRTLVATISDNSGVPTVGLGLPVLYWRINAGAYTAVTATSLGANQYQFILGSGVVSADVVSYYIVAQDNVGNTTASPSAGAAGFTANPPTAATPPSSPSSYTISSVLASGTYTVGAAGTYPTLTAAINDYNTRCLSGPIVFELLDATYAEAGGMTISKHLDGSAINTLTIRPASGVTAAVSATAANGPVLKILGSYVTIDGSNNGSNSRDLTISNLSATAPNVVVIGSTGTSPISNVTLKNTIAINGANTSSAIVTSDGTAVGTAGYFNTISITNNNIQKAFIGTFNISTPGNATGLTISNNTMSTSGANALRRVGIYVQGVDGVTISENTIGNFDATGGENDYGMWLATDTRNATVSNNTISNLGMTLTTGFAPSGIFITSGTSGANNFSVTGNSISGLSSTGGAGGISTNGIFLGFITSDVTISKNTISNIKNNSTTGWGANGILLRSTSATANCIVSNNFVSDVAAVGFAGDSEDDNGYGITVSSGAGYGIYYNTVNLTTNQTLAGGLPAAFLVTDIVTTAGAINLRNNIFANSQTGGSTERYSIYSGAANTVFSTINYNDYATSGPNLGFIGVNNANLTAIQTGFGGNANSLNVTPVFVNPVSNFHLIPASNIALDNLGTPIAGITTDYDNDTRSATPDMGADEFSNSSIVNLKAYIQGYYDDVNNQMVAAKFNQAVTSATNEVSTITLELLNQNTLAIEHTTTAELLQDGTAVCTFSSAPSGNFFLKVTTWNTVQTYSKFPVLVGSTPLSYDFSDAATKAAGDNQKLLETGVYGIYSGNFIIGGIQDPNIDNSDYSYWEADYNDGLFNYLATDLNGDANPDNADYSIWEGNYNEGIFEILPDPIP